MTDVKNSQNIHISGQGISVGDISNGVVVSSAEDWHTIFDLVLSSVSDERVVTELKMLRAEIEKGDEANEVLVRKYLEQIWQMAPDIWEVIVDTATNPLKGISTVVKKILEKVREEKGKAG